MKHTNPDSRRLGVALLALAVVAGCSRPPDQPTASSAPASSAPPASAPAAAEPAPAADAALSADLVARLVRPHSPVSGRADAPVTVVEFLDPACEACRGIAPFVEQIKFLYPDDVRVVVRFAAFHEGSSEAVRLLDAARRQGKFAPVLEALFAGQSEWTAHGAPPKLDRAWALAKQAGLDIARAQRDAASAGATDVLKIDSGDVFALKVERTPTFFVNGKPLPKYGPQELMTLVADEVKRAHP